MHFKRFSFLSLFIFLIFASELPAQGGYFDFTNYPGSTSTWGMGEEGVALRNGQDAFTFNPANLAFSEKVKLSLHHNPFQFYGSYPLNNFSAAFKLKGIGTFGLQYLRHNMGEFVSTTPDNPDGFGETQKYYNYSLALGYAGEVTDGLTMGLSVKYGRHVFGTTSVHGVLFSGGLNYQPAILDKRINLGFSLMNMGAPVEYEATIYTGTSENRQLVKFESESPVSSKLHLGLSAALLETDYISTIIQLGVAKYLVKDNESSFKALFNDWKDFPRDASLNTGLAFEWKPLDLGGSFSFLQKFYVGSVSFGPKEGSSSLFTHGAEIGIGFREFSFLAGYSGWWHNVSSYGYMRPEFPSETFQFSLEWDLNKYLNRSSDNKTSSALKNILVSLGSGYNFRKGYLIPKIYDPILKSRNSLSYSLEAAFYMNSNNALVTGLYYSSIPVVLEFPMIEGTFELKTKYESVGVYSAYRYHPLEVILPLYIQGGLGIVRINPVMGSSPKYLYQTSLNMALGANLDIPNSSLVISPEFNYLLMFVPIMPTASAPRLGGENQAALAVKIGYRF
jgi:hypothetical protein